MCGICGYYGPNQIEDSTLTAMRDTMIHRGPDDAGTWVFQGKRGNYIGLAHRRLSVIDLTSLGHQPMFSSDKTIAVVFNGEIYNFRDLRKELSQLGYSFSSDCDTEVIIYAFLEWGEDCFAKFTGMWAIAIYDFRNDRLVLSRDRIGKKPLYYYYDRYNRNLVFGSELKSVMAYPGFPRRINDKNLELFICCKYIDSPNTIFEDTYKVNPGTYLIFDDGEIREHNYWNLIDVKDKYTHSLFGSYKEAMDELEQAIRNAVACRLVADVPVGTFLSGGIDSSLITAISQSITEHPIKTFTIGFHDDIDEARYSKLIAGYLGTEHTELYIEESDLYNMLKDMPIYYDEPFSDPSLIPTMLVSKLAREDVTVILTGDGGDELFCGYKMYDWTYIAQHADLIGTLLGKTPGMNLLKSRLSPELRAFINNRDDHFKTQLFIEVMEENAARLFGRDIYVKFDTEKDLNYNNWQERRMILDMLKYLPDDILVKIDRAAMKYSLEGRCPLLDHNVIEQSLRIPHSYKYHMFDKKHILKELTYKYVPKELLDRPKQGFSIPLTRWLRTYLKPVISEYTDESYVAKQGLFRPEGVNWLVNMQEKSDKIMYSSMLWSYYVFQRWYEEYIA